VQNELYRNIYIGLHERDTLTNQNNQRRFDKYMYNVDRPTKTDRQSPTDMLQLSWGPSATVVIKRMSHNVPEFGWVFSLRLAWSKSSQATVIHANLSL